MNEKYFEVSVEGVFFVNVLDSFHDLLEVFEGEFLWKEDFFFQEFSQVSFTVFHDKIETFIVLFGFVHAGHIGTICEFELELN
jgi:hypothetical protein